MKKYTNSLELCYRSISSLHYFMNRPSVLIHSYFRLVKPQFSSFRWCPLLAPKKKGKKNSSAFLAVYRCAPCVISEMKDDGLPSVYLLLLWLHRLTYARGGAKRETEARIPKEEKIATCGLDNISDSASISYVRITDSDFIELIESIFFVHGMNPR